MWIRCRDGIRVPDRGSLMRAEDIVLESIVEESGMIIDCLGDSTTYGDDGRGGGGPEISWTSHIGALLGAEEARNYGKNGSRIAICSHHDDGFVERYESMDFSCDVILVMSGVNDFSSNVSLGQRGERDPRTFYGALEMLVTGLIERAPSAQVVFMTPAKRIDRPQKGLPSSFGKNTQGLTQLDYVNALKDVCDCYSVPVIDLYASSGISPFTPAQKDFMPDGLHYSPAGYERLARRIAAGLSSVVYCPR